MSSCFVPSRASTRRPRYARSGEAVKGRRLFDANRKSHSSSLDFAREHGALKQTVFEIAKRLGIEPEKRRSSNHRGQSISYINAEDGRRILEHLKSKSADGAADTIQSEQVRCVFCLLLLEPEIK